MPIHAPSPDRWRKLSWGAAGLLCLLPLLLTAVSGGMNWGAEDFAAWALMLLTAGLAMEAAIRLVRAPRLRVVAAILVVGAFLALWVELAVGIVGPG